MSGRGGGQGIKGKGSRGQGQGGQGRGQGQGGQGRGQVSGQGDQGKGDGGQSGQGSGHHRDGGPSQGQIPKGQRQKLADASNVQQGHKQGQAWPQLGQPKPPNVGPMPGAPQPGVQGAWGHPFPGKSFDKTHFPANFSRIFYFSNSNRCQDLLPQHYLSLLIDIKHLVNLREIRTLIQRTLYCRTALNNTFYQSCFSVVVTMLVRLVQPQRDRNGPRQVFWTA